MKLITKEIENKLRNPDGRPHLKLFAPWGAATWLISELDEDGDTMFGLADLGMDCPEMGYISLSELTEVRGPFGLKIERDISFEPEMTLEEYAEKARAAGRIVA